MRLDLLFPALPPAPDGIGDHTARLAAELARGHRVRVLTAQEAWAPIPGAAVERVQIPGVAGAGQPLARALGDDPPDWLVVQYNPFSYGRWGLNAALPRDLIRLRASGRPRVRLAVVVHEPFVPVDGWRNAVMTAWQRTQLAALGRAADLGLFSTEHWAERFEPWFSTTAHLPSGSNIPLADGPDPAETRRQLGVEEGEVVLGLFGSAHPSRLLGHARAAVEAVNASGARPRVLYVGPHGDRVRDALGDAPAGRPLLDAGRLPPEAVSRHLAAMDLHLAPFRRGVSARRGSFMAGLAHGVATASTRGEHTGPTLLQESGRSFALAPDGDPAAFARLAAGLVADPARRRAMGEAGQSLFEKAYAWPRIARRLEDALAEATAFAPVPGKLATSPT